MTPFKKNITKSIDNLNRICKTILSVYDNKTIDKMLSDNVLNQSGSDLTFNNTVAGGKFDWEILGKCEQDGTPTPENPIDVKVVTGDNDVVVQNKNLVISTLSGKSLNASGVITNSTATEYVPHAEQKVTLHNVPDLAGFENTSYVNTIEGYTDNWKVVRNIGKQVFNGTQRWSSDGGNYYYTIDNAKGTNSARPISNMFSYSDSDRNYGTFRFGNNNQNLIFNKSKEKYSSVLLWNEVFATNNAIVYYELAEPTEETITDTTLITDLNNMYNLMGYDGQTNISIVPAVGNATPSLKVTAFVTEKEV